MAGKDRYTEVSRRRLALLPDQGDPKGAHSSSRLVVPGARLRIEEFIAFLDPIRSGDVLAPSSVVLDFTAVEELVAPWTVHLAILVDLARRRSVRLTGLHGQPLQAMCLYRHNPEIRRLLGLSADQQRQPAA